MLLSDLLISDPLGKAHLVRRRHAAVKRIAAAVGQSCEPNGRRMRVGACHGDRLAMRGMLRLGRLGGRRLTMVMVSVMPHNRRVIFVTVVAMSVIVPYGLIVVVASVMAMVVTWSVRI